jgi:XisH protein
MPAIDGCEPQVVRALEKQGWAVSQQPVFLRVMTATYFADFQAKRGVNGNTQHLIIVEVKCFTNESTQQDELYRAIGQYLLYRSILKLKELVIPIYLAIPTVAFVTLFTQAEVKITVQDVGIKLIVVDLEKEEVAEWID